MWLIMLSVVEWATLPDQKVHHTDMLLAWLDQKVHHTDMLLAWLSSYSKASEAVLQHWRWNLLKKKTEVFAPFHRVFTKIRPGSPNCGTVALTEIFLLYPITGASIAHKLLARGLKTSLCFKDNSTAACTSNCRVCGTWREGRGGGAVGSMGVLRARRYHLRAGFQQCKSFVEMGTVKYCLL
jgi:hypothetical protein